MAKFTLFRQQKALTGGLHLRFFTNRQVKDRLFKFLFSEDRESLLQLYNALNHTAYEDADALEIVTINDIVYLSMKNDLAFILTGTLNLYEHQSTFNPNMPLRFFLYLSQEYQKILAQKQADLYGSTQISLPTPQCVVFYNGGREMPDVSFLKLSDAFERRDKQCGVELTVKVLNINFGNNVKLMEDCRKLWEYSYFISRIRLKIEKGMSVREAVDKSVTQCINEGVLSDFLEGHRAEVLGMILTEYNEKKTMNYLRREAMEIGREEGIRAMIKMCRDFNLSQEEAVEKIKSYFSLLPESAQTYMDRYWTDDHN